jgi:hypothetical protein
MALGHGSNGGVTSEHLTITIKNFLPYTFPILILIAYNKGALVFNFVDVIFEV